MPASRTASKISPRSAMNVLQSLPPNDAKPAPPHDGDPGGRFCGSARNESVASELPQIFHGARDALSWERNHAFCSTPSNDGAGWSRREFEALVLVMPPHRERLARLAETAELARTLFDEGWAAEGGSHVPVVDLPLAREQ